MSASRWRLAALLVAAGACSSPQPTPVQQPVGTEPGADAGAVVARSDAGDGADPQASLTSKDSKKVARTLVKVSAMRGLTATKAVPGVTLERGALVAHVKDKALREYPPAALRREGLLLQVMGFAPLTFDYLGEMMKLLDAQLEGFYEPKNGTMYLAADLHGTEAEATLAHELVHALQDQHWDLKKRSDYQPGHGDESMALACLAEGDATSLMLDYAMGPGRSALDLPPDSIREMMKGSMNIGDIQSVPHILRSTLVAPYVEGILFVNQLRKKGGWSAVDGAWERAPTTTEQILHLEKWEAHEGAIAIPAPSAAALGEGWKNEDEDSYGELGFMLTFAEWMNEDDARLAAAGWGGDRSSVYTKDDQLAYAVHVRYDDASVEPVAAGGARAKNAVHPKPDAFADRAMTKLSAPLKKMFGKPAVADASTLCFDRKDLGPLLFSRKDRDLVMISGPVKIQPDAWTGSATCALVKQWGAEILAQK